MNRTLLLFIQLYIFSSYIVCMEKNITLTSIQQSYLDKKKYSELNEQLYANDLTTEKLEDLFLKGATLDYKSFKNNQYGISPLEYRVRNFNDTIENNRHIFEGLLQLGANPNDAFSAIISCEQTEYLKIILNYNPKITNIDWYFLFNSVNYQNYDLYLKLFLKYATKKELTEGLTASFQHNPHNQSINFNPNLIKLFFCHNADMNEALRYLIDILPNPFCKDGTYMHNIMLLCQLKAFNQQSLDELKNVRAVLDDCIKTIEKNKPQ